MSGVLDTLFGSGPDTSGINDAARQNAGISQEALDFYKQQYADQAPARQQATDLALKVANQQLASSTQNDALSKDYADYSKSTFRPVEQAIVSDAQGYDTPQREQAAADAAVSDINQGVSAQRAATARDLARSGVSPDSAKMQSIQDAGDIGAAKAAAGAAYTARENVKTQGHARMMDAASLGRNLAANQATSAGVAINAGNSSVGNSQVPLNISSAATAQMGQGFNTAIQGNASAGSLYGTAGQLDLGKRGQDLNFTSSLINGSSKSSDGTSASGSGMMSFPMSDRNVKKDISSVDTAKTLDQIDKTPVKNWKYDPDKGGPDDGGQARMGPMAQDVKAQMGAKAAPGGKVLDLVTMNGALMAGIQQLSKQSKKTDARLAQLEARMK